MNEEIRDLELLDGYLTNELSDTERSLVEERLKHDDAFKSLFQEMKILFEGIRLNSRDQLLNQLKEKEAELKLSDISKSSSKVVQMQVNWTKRVMAIAAVGILLLGGVLVNKILMQNKMASELAAFTEPLPKQLLYSNARGEAMDYDELKKEASIAYAEENYEKSADILHTLIFEKNDTSLTVQKFYSNSILQSATKNCDDAINNLLEFNNDMEEFNSNKSEYIKIDLALTYIKCKDVRAARLILESLSLNSNQLEIRNKANRLLSIIN